MAVGVCFLAAPSTAQEGTASLTGRVEDVTGASLRGTVADLHSEQSRAYRAVADGSGVYRFPTVVGGAYTLELQQAGFTRLTVKGISVSDGEQKVLPILRMEVSIVGCSPHAVVEYLQLEKGQGTLAGTIKVDGGRFTTTVP